MLLYAKGQFYWSEQRVDGNSNRDHLNAARANAFATTQPSLDGSFDNLKEVECPFELQYLYIWFIELNSTRQNAMDICPIQYAEIRSWSKLFEIKISPFEIRVLKRIDDLYIKHFRDKK